MGWANKQIASEGSPNDPIDLTMYLSNFNNFSFPHEDNMVINQTTRLVINDPNNNDALMTDFTLKDINFDMNVMSTPKIALIQNQFNNFKFEDQEINEEGTERIDIREIMRDNSDQFDDIKGYIGDYFGNRRK